MKFSERYGYKAVRELVQLDSMDEHLRNALWSLLKVYVWDDVRASRDIYHGYYLSDIHNEEIQTLCTRLWFGYFKNPLDQLDNDWNAVHAELRLYFFKCDWYEVYDFIEYVANNYDRSQFKDGFVEACNQELEREVSAYRFVGGVISRIADQVELDEVEQALTSSNEPVRAHLRRALELLSSRKSPDYRNSIKESISAIESLAASSTGAEKGTLGQLLKRIEEKVGLHPALKTGFSNLYGYTSDEGGIRHALMEADTVRFEEAKFFLVVCSAFANFIRATIQTDG
jgi:hypothetical protein